MSAAMSQPMMVNHKYLPPSRKVQYDDIWAKITKFTVDHDHYCKLLGSLIVWMGLKCGFPDYQPKDVRAWFEKRWPVSSCEPHLHRRTTSKGANLLCNLSSLDLSVGHVLCLCQRCHFMGTLAPWMSMDSTKLPELEPRQPPCEVPFLLSSLACVCPPVCDWHGFILLPRIALAPQFTSDACLPVRKDEHLSLRVAAAGLSGDTSPQSPVKTLTIPSCGDDELVMADWPRCHSKHASSSALEPQMKRADCRTAHGP